MSHHAQRCAWAERLPELTTQFSTQYFLSLIQKIAQVASLTSVPCSCCRCDGRRTLMNEVGQVSAIEQHIFDATEDVACGSTLPPARPPMHQTRETRESLLCKQQRTGWRRRWIRIRCLKQAGSTQRSRQSVRESCLRSALVQQLRHDPSLRHPALSPPVPRRDSHAGRGSFGIVQLALNANLEMVAVKLVKRAQHGNKYVDSEITNHSRLR